LDTFFYLRCKGNGFPANFSSRKKIRPVPSVFCKFANKKGQNRPGKGTMLCSAKKISLIFNGWPPPFEKRAEQAGRNESINQPVLKENFKPFSVRKVSV